MELEKSRRLEKNGMGVLLFISISKLQDIQLEILREEDCRLFQGYYFSRPLSPEEFKNLLDRDQKLPEADFSVK